MAVSSDTAHGRARLIRATAPTLDPMRAEARTEAGHASAAQQDAKQPALLD
ncbi:hypothetical protein [Nocardia sp. NPDC047038]|uniref:hypothetical protein n=1 Tax=Nocardia sp. NPDC047038 TaxID=3154338 RepID=UPI0033F77262